MKIRYWPEGRLIHTEDNRLRCTSPKALHTAMEQETVLEGRVLLCDPACNLHVKLGNYTGTIPHEEGAIGICDGTTRDIALLSRVGKPISTVITGINTDGTLCLSRRKAQEQAQEHLLLYARSGDILPATITHMESFGAFVDIGCGLPSLMGIETLSVSRISHPNQRFLPEQEVFAAVTDVDHTTRRVSLTHKELLGTWEENAKLFAPGMTVTGTVRSIKEYGIFVELTPNLSGLAELRPDYMEGDSVSVYIKSILPDRMKIKLLIIGKLPTPESPPPIRYFQTGGRLTRWEYPPKGCSKVGAVTVFAN